MVTFHVCLKIGLLSESLSTFKARESVFVLVWEMNYLVFLQSVFPPETFSTEATFMRSFASVCHHMLPEFKPDQMMKYATRLILILRYGNIEPNEKRMLLGY